MDKIRQVLPYFLVPYILFLVSLLLLVSLNEKGDLHLMMNGYHTPLLDVFFKYFTYIGENIPFIFVIVLLFYQLGASIYLLATMIFNVLVTNGLKLVFKTPRPTLYFSENFPDITLPLVEGVKLYLSNGFPSGHTSAAFAFMTCIALMVKSKTVAAFCCITAILVGYSRVYLSQHFAEDIILGSVIGIFSGCLFYSFFLILKDKYCWANKSILGRVR